MLIGSDEYAEHGLDPADEALAGRLRSIEARIRAYTNNGFQVRSVRVEAASQGGILLGAHPGMRAGDTVQVSASGVNDGLYVVESIDSETGTLALDPPLLDAPSNRVTLVRYPPDIVAGALGLLEYEAARPAGKAGVASESISRHSVSYDSSGSEAAGAFAGYPLRVTGFMRPYRRARL